LLKFGQFSGKHAGDECLMVNDLHRYLTTSIFLALMPKGDLSLYKYTPE
jgi:hypothetical protein